MEDKLRRGFGKRQGVRNSNERCTTMGEKKLEKEYGLGWWSENKLRNTKPL